MHSEKEIKRINDKARASREAEASNLEVKKKAKRNQKTLSERWKNEATRLLKKDWVTTKQAKWLKDILGDLKLGKKPCKKSQAFLIKMYRIDQVTVTKKGNYRL